MAITIAAMAKRVAGMTAAWAGLSVVNTKVVSRIPAATPERMMTFLISFVIASV